MKKLFLPIFLAFISYTLFSQNQPINLQEDIGGKLIFETKKHDFGVIKEDSGSVNFRFTFINQGNSDIKLTYVNASCGCTTPKWNKDPIKPNETGFIEAVYDPKNRPGDFYKTITLKTDGQPSVDVLSITGKVIPRTKGPSDFYPYEVGNLRFSTSNIYLDKIKHTEVKTKKLVIYNQGQKPIALNTTQANLPEHITLQLSNTSIEPKDTIILTLTFDAKKQGDWGYNYGSFELGSNDESTPNKKLYFGATIEEDFSHLAADSPLPKVNFSKTTHNFGKIKPKQTVSTRFAIYNEGKSELIIRKTKASCGCTATQPQKEILVPKDSTIIDVSFYSGERSGKQRKSITVITNDPKNAQTTLWIEAEVEE